MTPWTVDCQAPLFLELFRQEHWSGLQPFPPPGNLPDPGMEPASPATPALQAEPLLPSHLESPFTCGHTYNKVSGLNYKLT